MRLGDAERLVRQLGKMQSTDECQQRILISTREFVGQRVQAVGAANLLLAELRRMGPSFAQIAADFARVMSLEPEPCEACEAQRKMLGILEGGES